MISKRSSPDSEKRLPPEEESLNESNPLFQAVLGQVRAALRPNHISIEEVRDALAMARELGFNPVEMYQLALEGRPPEYEDPPLLEEVLPKEQPEQKVLGPKRVKYPEWLEEKEKQNPKSVS